METESTPPANNQPATTTAVAPPAKTADADSHSHEHHDYFPSQQAFVGWAVVCLIGFVGLVLALGAHHLLDAELTPGDKLDHDIYASHASVVVDEGRTAQARQAVYHEVMPVFKKKEGEEKYTHHQVHLIFDQIEILQQSGVVPLPGIGSEAQFKAISLPDSEFKTRVAQNDLKHFADQLAKQHTVAQAFKAVHPDIPEQAILVAVSVSPKDLAAFTNKVESTTAHLCHTLKRLPADASTWTAIAVEFLPDSWDQSTREATARIICERLRPNLEIDPEQTKKRMQELAAQVKPVMNNIAVGQLIAQKGQPLTKEDISILKSQGIEKVNRLPFVIGLCVSLAAAVALVALFIYAIEPQHLFSSSSVGLIYTVAINVFAVSSILGNTFPQFVPLPSAALILTIFLGQRIAIGVSLTLAIFLAVDGKIDFPNLVALGTAAGAAIGFYSRKRHALISTGLIMALAQGLGYIGAASTTGAVSPEQLISGVTFQFLAGLVLAIISIGSLPFLESLFGMITPFRLAELTDADQPLLRKLEENAPGTYQHSLAVANLAEAGARAIGVDVNLVRAGAFYHDVGKMVRPRYFIENQLGDKNPHDSMTPEESRERVLAHVTDGIALAKEYKLPKAVEDFIPMHQGTSLMAYFYYKACVRDGTDKVNPADYRYPGPKPQSKETAIVMLADVSEAVTHSMREPSQEEVEEAMAKVFQNRWDDGQFSEASLTYNELQRVKRAFVHVWRTLHHERLKYPSTTTGKMAVPPSPVTIQQPDPAPSEPSKGDCCG